MIHYNIVYCCTIMFSMTLYIVFLKRKLWLTDAQIILLLDSKSCQKSQWSCCKNCVNETTRAYSASSNLYRKCPCTSRHTLLKFMLFIAGNRDTLIIECPRLFSYFLFITPTTTDSQLSNSLQPSTNLHNFTVPSSEPEAKTLSCGCQLIVFTSWSCAFSFCVIKLNTGWFSSETLKS